MRIYERKAYGYFPLLLLQKDGFCMMRIDDMGLSVRAVNVLHHNHIETAEQLIAAAEQPEKMMSWRNLGVKTLNELLAKAEELKCGGTKEDGVDDCDLPHRTYVLNLELMQSRQQRSIDRSKLSGRACRTLEENSITDLLQVVGWTTDNYTQFPGTGAGTAAELYSKVTANANSLYIAFEQSKEKQTLIGRYCFQGNGELKMADKDAWNALLAAKSQEAWEVLWRQLPMAEGNLGIEVDLLFCDEIPQRCMQQAGDVCELLMQLGVHVSADVAHMIAIRLTAIQGDSEAALEDCAVLDTFFENHLVTDVVDGLLVDYLIATKRDCTIPELLTALPEHALSARLVDRAIERMTDRGQLLLEGRGVALPMETAEEWAASLHDERLKDILLSKFNGETLEAIGQRQGLSRERVRQLIAKSFGDTVFYEDRYRYVYTTYLIDREVGVLLWGTSSFHYLDTRYKHGAVDLECALEDEKISVDLRRRIEQVLHRNYLRVGEKLIPRRRPEVMDYVIQICCRERISYDEFSLCYKQFCDQHGLSGDKFALDTGSVKNRLALKQDVLYGFHGYFRYYPIEQYDFSELLDTLNLAQYKDVSYSALYFFRLFPELMQQYDIRDEYELHNLLRKLLGMPNAYDLEFSKMPRLNFGEPNVDEQVLELLIEKAPVAQDELAATYEQRYGVKLAVVTGTYFKCIAEYLKGRTYYIEAQDLPAECIAAMKMVLTADFYSMAELSRIYAATVQGAKKSDLTQYVIRSLGFLPYSEYIIRDTFHSATDYFRWVLLKDECMDLELLPAAMTNLNQFTAVMMEVKADYEIIEYMPKRLINISRFRTLNVGKDELREYCRAVFDYPLSARYFSIHSLRASGFRHALDDLGFDDWFYSSVLQQDYDHFSVQRMGKERVICKGRNPFSRTDVLADIVEQYRKIDIDDLVDVLRQRLGIRMDTDDIVMLIDRSEMYYDRIMRTVYVDYDTYFDDI